jgi:hypothetical protein
VQHIPAAGHGGQQRVVAPRAVPADPAGALLAQHVGLAVGGVQVDRERPGTQVLVLLNPEYDPNTYSVANGEIMADFVVGRGGISREEADAWTQDLQQLGREGRYFFSLNRYLFLATA